jgi:putative transposase
VEQIVGVLKQAEVGVLVAEVIRKAGVQRADLLPLEGEVCRSRSGPGASDGTVTGREPASKAVGCGLTLDKTMLQDVLSKKGKPSRRGPMVDRLLSCYRANGERAVFCA